MNSLVIKPEGWECNIEECPPGFFVYKGELCLKTEYGDCEAYCCSGEKFVGEGGGRETTRNKLIVQPCIAVWEENN